MGAIDLQAKLWEGFEDHPTYWRSTLALMQNMHNEVPVKHAYDTVSKIITAPAYEVGHEWTELLMQARTDLADMDAAPILNPEDAFTKRGFVYLKQPIPMKAVAADEISTETVPVRAFAWYWSDDKISMAVGKDGEKLYQAFPTKADYEKWKDGQKVIGGYGPGDYEVVQTSGFVTMEFVDTKWLAQHLGWKPENVSPLPIHLYDLTAWGTHVPWAEYEYGVSPDRPEHMVDSSAAEQRRTLYAFWQLVSSFVHVERPSRSERRRFSRATGRDEPDEIRVVTLRRAYTGGVTDASDPTVGAEAIDYQHRWIVRGHWRQQWYPSLNAHKPVWITPYVKGPDDKPLIVKKEKFRVSR